MLSFHERDTHRNKITVSPNRTCSPLSSVHCSDSTDSTHYMMSGQETASLATLRRLAAPLRRSQRDIDCMPEETITEYEARFLNDCRTEFGTTLEAIVHERRSNTIVVTVDPRQRRRAFREFCSVLPYVKTVYTRGKDQYYYCVTFDFVPPVRVCGTLVLCALLLLLAFAVTCITDYLFL